MKKTKIAIVTYTLNFGGLERVVSNQSMLLDGLGFEVTLFVLENKIGYPFAGDIHVYNFQSKEKLLKKIYNYKKLKENISEIRKLESKIKLLENKLNGEGTKPNTKKK